MRKKQIFKQILIYVRYISPPIFMLIVFAMTFVRSYRFVTEGKAGEALSTFSLLKDYFELTRNVLFGREAQEAVNLIFSRTLFTVTIVSVVLCIVAFLVAVWSAIVAMMYFVDDNEERSEQSRAVFVTFLPNRIFLCAAETLMLPLLAIPYIIPYLCKSILNTRVVITLRSPDSFLVAVTALLLIFVLSAVCARFEKEFDADVFKKSRRKLDVAESEAEEEYVAVFDSATMIRMRSESETKGSDSS